MIDAHNHLHDARLRPHRSGILAELAQLGVERAVVNGTREDDWNAVAAMANEGPSTPASVMAPATLASRSNRKVGVSPKTRKQMAEATNPATMSRR